MKILVDMNLSPEGCDVLAKAGWTARHWSSVGEPDAGDDVLVEWARENSYVILTQDLDFTAIVALSRSRSPSIVQLRAQGSLPEDLAPMLLDALGRHESLLEAGAVVTINQMSARARVLPLAEIDS